MFTSEKYCDVRLAIGELVLQGHIVEFFHPEKPQRPAIIHRDENNNPILIAETLRDGTRYIVKTDWIQSFIDETAAR